MRLWNERHAPRVLVLLSLLSLGLASEYDHKYEESDRIGVWAARVGPLSKPFEAYNMYDLPYCRPDAIMMNLAKKEAFLGDALQGCNMEHTGITLRFNVPVSRQQLCVSYPSARERERFMEAAYDRWVITLYVDDIPVRGTIAPPVEQNAVEVKDFSKVSIYTQFSFTIEYNKKRVVGVSLEMKSPTALDGPSLGVSYDVKWEKSEMDFVSRYEKVMESELFASKAYWLAIINSMAIVVVMVAIAARIVRKLLNADIQKYSTVLMDDGLDVELADIAAAESGWKQIREDVLRTPPFPLVLCSLIGFGNHLVLLVLFFVVATLAGNLYVTPGHLAKAFCVSSTCTSFFAGYYATGALCRMTGNLSTRNHIISSVLSIGGMLILGAVFFLPTNLLSSVAGSNLTISYSTIFKLLRVWALYCLPPGLLGSRVAKKLHENAKPQPCREVPRPIKVRFLTSPLFIASLSAVMPFSCIVMEVFFILKSFWGLKMYYLFDTLLIIFLLLMAVTASSSIAGSYVLLSAEDYRWQWSSWGGGAFTGFYCFLYSMFFYEYNTNISGVVPTVFYFAFSLFFSSLLAVLCGALAYLASSIFVKKLYINFKSD
eukprot:CAMPEP_0184747054 /NCGR_PEP_ID=MMETSP0315-20130426/9461_1 /TAXON_ID=101924 /ORGANISM="Rhodosorus marinus, Strain UTEX LB 2760" /LENGTH=599 /DNA_ID=CAMNT_0027219813 /DNA_START=169 /DNA_END=1968 /DNA_ORIENTATION=-